MKDRETNCKEAERWIQQALDGTLSSTERESLDRHLASCEACARAWDEYRALSRVATAWARRPALVDEKRAASLTSAILAQVEERQMRRTPRARIGFWPALACFLVALCALSYFLSLVLPAPAPIGWHFAPIGTPSALFASLAETARGLPEDALAAWRSLFDQPISYQPALAALGAGLFCALILATQQSRRRAAR